MHHVLIYRDRDSYCEVHAKSLGWELYEIEVVDLITGTTKSASKPIVGIENADDRVQEVLRVLEGAYIGFVKI